MNGTTWYLAGFQYNATEYQSGNRNADAASVIWAAQLNSTLESSGILGVRSNGLNGTALIFNSTIGYAGQNATFFNASDSAAKTNNNYWRSANYYIDDLVELRRTNGLGSIFFIGNPSWSLAAGFANGTIATPQQTTNYYNATTGSGLHMMVQNTTYTSASDVAGTWYVYGILGNHTAEGDGTRRPHVYGLYGQLTLATGKTGSVSYGLYNGTSAFFNATNTAVTWDNSTMFTVQVNATGIGNLFTGALSSDKTYMVGYNGTTAGASFTVANFIALKDASTFSSTDFKSAAFNFVGYKTAPFGGQFQTNGTLGVMYTDANAKITKGNSTDLYSAGNKAGSPVAATTALADVTPTFGTATTAGITHGTMVIGSTTFTGTKKNNVLAGLLTDNTNRVVGLQVMTTVGVSASEPVAPSAATLAALLSDVGTTGSSAAVAGNTATLGVTDLLSGAEAVTLPTKVLNFLNATDASIKSTFPFSSTQNIDNSYPTLTFAATGVTGSSFAVMQFDLEGNNINVSSLPTPYKFYVNATTNRGNGTNAVNTMRAFTYRNSGSTITDGCWWITAKDVSPYNALSYSADKLLVGSTYTVYVAIRDNGNFDMHPSLGTIVDPVKFVSGSAGGGAAGGSSSGDGGCVLNPMAGLSVEFLLLLLAPLAYFLRRKK